MTTAGLTNDQSTKSGRAAAVPWETKLPKT